jgi:hypothetical protein
VQTLVPFIFWLYKQYVQVTFSASGRDHACFPSDVIHQISIKTFSQVVLHTFAGHVTEEKEEKKQQWLSALSSRAAVRPAS